MNTFVGRGLDMYTFKSFLYLPVYRKYKGQRDV